MVRNFIRPNRRSTPPKRELTRFFHMSEPTSSPALRWYTLSARTTAVLLQVLLWVLLCGFYIAWNNRPNYHFAGPIWPLVLMEMGFAILLFNCLVYLVIPRWLLRGHKWRALAGGILLIFAFKFWMFAGSWLAETHVAIDPVLRRTLHGFYVQDFWRNLLSVQGILTGFFGLLATMLFPVVISCIAYTLIVDRRRLALERDHLHLERSYLKAQINPQFLFNTLGSLHTMTRTRDARAGDVVLHLADLMRYTLYETDTERVLLSRELEFLEDYLALERLRHPATSIEHQVIGTATTQQIAPLLLHPFLEQLFAGLGAAPTSAAHISSTVRVAPAAMTLTLVRTTAGSLAPAYRTDAGVAAALRRLRLQYPKQHTARVTENQREVQVFLSIPF